MPEEKSSKPREMVHRAQAQAARWLYELHRARQDLPEAVDRERARAELHGATMLYWEQIKRFRYTDHIVEEWHEEPAFGDSTLDDIRRLRLETETQQVNVTDPDTSEVRAETRQVPWQLTPEQALAVIDQLDACANALGFDARPQRQAPTTGAGEAADTDPDDMDHINTEIEVGGDV